MDFYWNISHAIYRWVCRHGHEYVGSKFLSLSVAKFPEILTS